MILNSQIIAVDVDGCLTHDLCWTEEECKKARPNRAMINLINKLEPKNFVVVYTARRDNLIPATLDWLRRNGVHFQAISNHKMAADIYFDDRAINLTPHLEGG